MANNDRETTKRKRGRPADKLVVRLFLLDPDSNVTKVTKEIGSKKGISDLIEKGCGPPPKEQCVSDDKVEFSFELTNEEFKQKIIKIYPNIENACFMFMRAGKDNTLEELNPGRCCYRCYTPENVYHSERGQGRLYIRKIAENEILPCNHGVSPMKRLRSMIGGSQQLFIPIAPKPAPTAIPANIGVATASGKNTVTSAATSTNNQLSGSLGNDSMTLLSNLPVLDLSSSSIVVAQTKSTPPVQNSGNNVTQGTTSLNESTLPVSSFWNSIAQGLSPASVSRSESRPVIDSSVNMVTQSQLPVPSTIVSQILSTPLVYNSGNMVAQSPLPLTTSVSQTASRPAVHSLVNVVTQSQLSAPSTSVSPTSSTPLLQNFPNMMQQSQLQMLATVSQTASTPLLQNSTNMVQHSQLPMLATVPQTISGQPFHSSVNVVPQGQFPSSSETAIRPPVDGSFNMVTQNQLPMSTSVVTGNTSMPPFQNFGNMVEQGQLEEFVSGTANQPMLATPSQIASFKSAPLTVREVERLRAILEGQATPLIGDTNGNLDISGNRNILQATATGFQTTNEVMVGLRDPYLVSITNATSPPNTAFDMWAQSPGLTTLANASEIVQRGQYIDILGNSLNLQRNVDLSQQEKLRKFLENVESTKTLKISLDVLDNDALMNKLNESTINIHTVEIQSTCEVHQVLRKYSLPSHLKVLHINENNLNLDDISELVGSLSSMSALHELDLCHTKFREGSFVAFICVLTNYKNLTSLILTDNGLTEQEITRLITKFESMKNLKNLNLSKSNLTSTQANDILQKHGQAKNILSLDLSQTALQGNEIVIGICQLQSLEELNLSHNHIKFFPLPSLEEEQGDLPISAKVISLSSNHMTPNDISQFCSLIRSDLLKLILDFNHISYSIWSLCSLGRWIKHLKVLSLANTDICSDFDGLAALLSLVSNLEELNLSYNNLMAKDFQRLHSPLSNIPQLKRLNLSMNAVRSDGIRALADILKNVPLLEGLDMSRSCIKEDDISVLCKGLVTLEKLKYLNLSGNRIVVEVLEDDLFLPPTLEELIFSDIIHGEKLFAKMKGLENLRKLHLNKAKLRACDVKAMATMLPYFPNLEELSLADLVVPYLQCGTILTAMKSLTNIKKLNLSGIRLLDDRAVADMLSSLFSLEELVLTNMIVWSMDYEKLFSAIKLLNHLRKLNFGGVKLRDANVFFDMLSSLSNLEEIVFPDFVLTNTDCMTGYFSALESLRYLKNLDLRRTKPVSGALACVLPSLQLLENLVLEINSENVFDNSRDKQLLSALGKLKYLKELNLIFFTKTGIKTLVEVLPSLQLLEKLVLEFDRDACFCNSCAKPLFGALGKLKYLKELHLGDVGVTQTGPEPLAEVLPSLQLLEKLALKLGSEEDYDNLCVKQLFGALGKLKYLKELNLEFLGAAKTSVETLVEVLPSLQLLEKLVLELNPYYYSCNKQLFGALGKLKYLKELYLKSFGISETSAETLAEVLPSLHLLKKLLLEFVENIHSATPCYKQLFGALGKLKYLKEIDLRYNITQTGAESLAEVLPSLQLLEVLKLQMIFFHCGGGKQLFAGIGKLKYLKEIDLRRIDITETGAESLAEMLPSLQLLEVLKLGRIVFDNANEKQLFAGVGKLKHLKEIDLRRIDITQTGAESLAEVLPSLQLLEVLTLGRIVFDNGGGKQLFDALGKLKYLKNLGLDCPFSSRAIVACFAEALPTLHCLEKLSLRLMTFENGGDQQIFAAMESLRFLNELVLIFYPFTQTGATTLISVLPKLHNLKCIKLCGKVADDENKTLVRKLEEVASRIPESDVRIS